MMGNSEISYLVGEAFEELELEEMSYLQGSGDVSVDSIATTTEIISLVSAISAGIQVSKWITSTFG